jgi:divalent metal cation (Fe/Co/Zn/Cd) transporter
MPGAAVMLISCVTNIFVSRMLFRVGRETDSIALVADGWQLRTDVWTSLGVAVGLRIIWIGHAAAAGNRSRLDRPGLRHRRRGPDHQERPTT